MMNDSIKKIYRINTNWWDSFTSCLVGTILGIAITFGISGYNEAKAKKEMERKIQILTISSIQQTFDQLGTKMVKLEQMDSTLTAIMDFYPDSVNKIPPKLASDLFSQLLSFEFNSNDQTADRLFSSDIEVWKSIDNLSTINTIGQTLSYKQFIINALNETNAIKSKIAENIGRKKYFLGFNSHQEALRIFFDNPENLNLALRLRMYVNMLNMSKDIGYQLLTRIKTDMHITDEDLKSIYSDDNFSFRDSSNVDLDD